MRATSARSPYRFSFLSGAHPPEARNEKEQMGLAFLARPEDRAAVAPAVNTDRRVALAAGALFIITFITSIPALYLYQPVLDHPARYIAGAGANNRILLGAFLEVLLIVANVGTAVVLFPILKRQSEMLALGFVTARLMESAFIAVGILSVLAVVSLQQDAASAGSGSLAVTLAAIKDWTFLLGPGFVVGIGNGMLLGYLMYRSGLVPRRMAMLGLIGGPLICVSGIAVLLNVIQMGGVAQSVATIPEFFWELSLGIYLTVWGFQPSPILSVPEPDGVVIGPQHAVVT
jgi:Domain of unknown function (DUF4386)